jgi:beta-aspartyl-peptidase (threonine type)
MTFRVLFLWGISFMSFAAEPPVAIGIHGGAGTIERDAMSAELEATYLEFLDYAITAGYEQLSRGEPGLAVVVNVIQLMEDSPLFNAGHGAVYTWDGTHELDASIMHGAKRDAGAVAGISTVKSPIALARAVMERSPHVMLAGSGAEAPSKRMSRLDCNQRPTTNLALSVLS